MCRYRCVCAGACAGTGTGVCAGMGVSVQVQVQVQVRVSVQAHVWYLDAAVAPVGHDDVAIAVHGHPCGSVELPVALSMRPELEQELALCIVHLVGTGGTTHGSHGRSLQPNSTRGPQHLPVAALTFTEWLWKSVTTISFLLLTATKWGPGETKEAQLKWDTGNSSPRLWGSSPGLGGLPCLRGTEGFSSSLMAGPGWTQSPGAWTEPRIQSPQDEATARI